MHRITTLSTGVFILALLLFLSTSLMTCRGQQLCSEDTWNDLTVSTRCDNLTDKLEELLLTKNNLYILRNTFFPQLQAPPVLVLVKYKLDGFPTIQLDETVIAVGWSSSSLFTAIDPTVIFALDTGLVTDMLLKVTNITELQLELNWQGSPIPLLYTTEHAELTFILAELTTRLRAYAKDEGRTNLWKEAEYKGYSWTYSATKGGSFFLVVAEFSLLMIAFVVSINLALGLGLRLQKTASPQFRHTFFWVSTSVCGACNFIDLGFIFVSYLVIVTNNSALHMQYGFCKVVLICTALVLGFIWMLIGCCVSLKISIAFLNLGVFVVLTAAKVIPLFLLSFVNPVIVLGGTCLIVSLQFAYVVLIATCLKLRPKVCFPKRSECEQCKVYACFFIPLFALFVFSFSMIHVFLQVLSSGAETSNLSIFTFLPSAAIGTIGYLMKRKFLDKKSSSKLDYVPLPSDASAEKEKDTSLIDLESGPGDPEEQEDTEHT